MACRENGWRRTEPLTPRSVLAEVVVQRRLTLLIPLDRTQQHKIDGAARLKGAKTLVEVKRVAYLYGAAIARLNEVHPLAFRCPNKS